MHTQTQRYTILAALLATKLCRATPHLEVVVLGPRAGADPAAAERKAREEEIRTLNAQLERRQGWPRHRAPLPARTRLPRRARAPLARGDVQ